MALAWVWSGKEIIWSAANSIVTRLVVDEHQLSILLAHDEWSMQLTLEQAFSWRDGSKLTVVDPQVPQSIEPLLTAIGRRAETLRIDGSGELALTFEGGLALNASPADLDESWNLSATGCLKGLMYVAAPGGLVRWEPTGV